MPIPEPLVAIRTYPSKFHSEGDYRRLLEAGITVYRGSWAKYPTLQVMLRVPESQAERALALLSEPPHDWFQEPDKRRVCPWCGFDEARYPSPFAWILTCVGAVAAVSLAMRRRLDLAGIALGLTVIVMYFGRIGSAPVCTNCGRGRDAPP